MDNVAKSTLLGLQTPTNRWVGVSLEEEEEEDRDKAHHSHNMEEDKILQHPITNQA